MTQRGWSHLSLSLSGLLFYGPQRGRSRQARAALDRMLRKYLVRALRGGWAWLGAGSHVLRVFFLFSFPGFCQGSPHSHLAVPRLNNLPSCKGVGKISKLPSPWQSTPAADAAPNSRLLVGWMLGFPWSWMVPQPWERGTERKGVTAGEFLFCPSVGAVVGRGCWVELVSLPGTELWQAFGPFGKKGSAQVLKVPARFSLLREIGEGGLELG